jgi:O-antigen/teichoic acid export membrane protein
MSRALVGSAAGLSAAALGYGATGVILANAVAVLLPSLLTAPLARAKELFQYDRSLLKELCCFAAPLGVSFGLGAVSERVDRAIILWLHGAAAVGYWSLSVDLASRAIFLLAAPIGAAGLPIASRAIEGGDARELHLQLRRNLGLLIFFVSPAAIGLALTAPIVSQMLGLEFREPVQLTLPIVAAASFVAALRANYLDHAFHLSKTGRSLIVVTGVQFVSLIVFNLLFTPSLPLLGPAISLLISHLLAFMTAWIISRRYLIVPLLEFDFLRILPSIGLFGAALLLIPTDASLYVAATYCAIAGVAYILFAIVFDFSGSRGDAIRRIRSVAIGGE